MTRVIQTAFTALAFILSSCLPLPGQSTVKVEGYVFSEAGQPLAGADVVVLGSGVGAATDAGGHFAIENLFAGEYQLQARFLGYRASEPRRVLVSRDFVARVVFRLAITVLAFEEVVVEETRPAESGSDFLEVMTRAEIVASGARTVGDVLAYIPGVDVVDEDGARGTRISIRGSQANQVLVTLDGIPLNDPLFGDVDLNQISLESVQELRIVKGGNSSRFGSGAVGGAVEIITRPAGGAERKLGANVGSFGRLTIQPTVSGRAGGLDYLLSFDHQQENGDFRYRYQLLDGTPVEQTRLNAGFSSDNLLAKVRLDLGGHEIRLQSSSFASERGLPGQVFAWTPRAEARSKRHLLLATYAFENSRWQRRLHLSRDLSSTEFENNPPEDAPLRFRTVPAYHSRYRVLSYRGSFENTFYLHSRLRAFAGITLRHDDFDDRDLLAGSAGPVRATDNFNASVSYRTEWDAPKPGFLTRVVLNQALRFDYISFENGQQDRRDTQFSPRVGVFVARRGVWSMSLRANWGRSFRAPTFADLFFQDFRIKGNAGLLPEKSSDFDAGLDLGFPVAGRLDIAAAYFHHKIKNLIVWELGSHATFRPLNTDALLQGWELSAAWEFWRDRIRFDVSGVLLQALDKSGRRTTHNKRLTYRPERTMKIGLRVNLGGLALTYHRRMAGERFVTAANTVSMPAYAVDDLSALLTRNFGRLSLTVKASVLNFRNKRYQVVENAPLPGRQWRVGLELLHH